LAEAEEIIEKILAKRGDLKKEDIRILLDKKKRDSGDLLSDEGAARLLAQELLIDVKSQEAVEVRIKDLIAGLGDVTVSGRILVEWPIQEFRRTDGSLGRMRRLLLADGGGEVRCVVWGMKAQELSSLGLEGKIIRVRHGYTREGLADAVELHVGDRGEVDVSPPDVMDNEYPKLEDLLTDVCEVNAEQREVNVVGVVSSPPRIISFKKPDREGLVLRTSIGDETGNIGVVAWNERAEELKGLNKGDVIQIVCGKVKRNAAGFPEVHLGKRSKTSVLREKPPYLREPTLKPTKIFWLNPGMGSVNLLARIVKLGKIREVRRSSGETTQMGRMLLGDETGIVQAFLWDENAGLVEKAREGDVLFIRDASVRDRLGRLSLSLGKTCVVEINPKLEDAEIPPYPKTTSIDDLSGVQGLVVVEGKVAEDPSCREVQTSDGKLVEVASMKIEDGTGLATILFWRELARKVTSIGRGSRIKVTGAYVTSRLTGEVELSSSGLTTIEVVEKQEPKPAETYRFRRLVSLKDGESAQVKAVILEVLDKSYVCAVCGSCGSEMRFEGDKFFCNTCGPSAKSSLYVSLCLKIDDGSRCVDAYVESPQAEKLLSVESGEFLSMMVKQKVSKTILPLKVAEKSVGTEIEASGIMEFDRSTGNPKFYISSVKVTGQV